MAPRTMLSELQVQDPAHVQVPDDYLWDHYSDKMSTIYDLEVHKERKCGGC